MRPLLTAAEMREMDAHTIERVGVPGVVLMETAGRGVERHLWRRFGERLGTAEVAVLCGKGNNGGDGFVVARCLLNRGVRVCAYLLGAREEVGGDARVHLEAYRGAGGQLREVSAGGGEAVAAALAAAGLVVDALLGTGLDRDVRGLAADAIGWVNAATAPVVSVDIPSGVSADSGRICGVAVAADLTVTFAHPKRGHYLYPGAGRCGELEVVDIGIPAVIDALPAPSVRLVESGDLHGQLVRPADAHKGSFGHLLVVGGSPGKAGAPGLAALGALRSGVGLCTLAWPRGLAGENRLPLDVMTLPLSGAGEHRDQWSDRCAEHLQAALADADAVVVGPGMGTTAGAAAAVAAVLGTAGAPVLVDADGLNLLARTPGVAATSRRALLLTPHPGEAARLLDTDSRDIQSDRIGALRELTARYRATVILKGAATLVGHLDGRTCLIPTGNPGMATAGSGDVLSGVAGALLARGVPPFAAAWSAAYLHGAAGDRAAAERGEEGMLASDLLQELPAALAGLC